MGEVTVHVGGHVTLLFSIHSEPLLARNQGSKGAGLCLEHGVISTVKTLEQGDDEISVFSMDGERFARWREIVYRFAKSFRTGIQCR